MSTRVSFDLFRRLLELETHKALRLQYPIAVLCLTPDLEDQLGTTLTNRLADAAAAQIRSTDVVGTLATSCLALLLVDAVSADLSTILNRVGERLTLTLMAATGRRKPITWSAGATAYPGHTTDPGGLLDLATSLMARARREGGNQLLLPATPASP